MSDGNQMIARQKPKPWPKRSIAELRAIQPSLGKVCAWSLNKKTGDFEWTPYTTVEAEMELLARQPFEQRGPRNLAETLLIGMGLRAQAKARSALARVSAGDASGRSTTARAYRAFRRGAITESQARELGVTENAIRAQRLERNPRKPKTHWKVRA